VLAGFSADARATETSPNEVLLGTFHIGPKADPRAAPRQDGVTRIDSRPEIGADALYDAATRELSAGKRVEAQRLFEQIVARFPDDAMAAQSRRQLALIYLDDLQAAAARRAAQPAVPGAPGQSTSGTVETAAQQTGDPWRAEISRAHPSIESFAVEAGDRVFFSSGSAELGGRGRLVVEAQAQWLKSRPDVLVVVEGHADEPASDEDNLRLSQARAEAVKSRLLMSGIVPERVAVTALGRRQRVSECAAPDCAARNRRAVTLVRYADDRQNMGALAPYPAAEIKSDARPGGLPDGEHSRASR